MRRLSKELISQDKSQSRDLKWSQLKGQSVMDEQKWNFFLSPACQFVDKFDDRIQRQRTRNWKQSTMSVCYDGVDCRSL